MSAPTSADRLRALPSLTGTAPPWDLDPAPDDPMLAFDRWFGLAIEQGVPEPHAMTLSTVDAGGVPDARVLILKGVADGRWGFAGGGESPKGRQLRGQDGAALTFYWPTLLRSVRIRGHVRPAEEAASAADFAARSVEARAVALATRPGEWLVDPLAQEAAVARAARQLMAGQAPRSDWTLWWLRAEHVEFWQGSSDRRHCRLRYERTDRGWQHGRLWS